MTIKFGVIGTGFTRGTQIPALLMHPGTSVVGVASRTGEKAQSTARDFGIPFWTTDYRELLAQDLDAVIITTPTVYHAEMTEAACGRGLHVICEKPTAMNVSEAQRMLKAAREANVVHMIDHEFRYVPVRAYLEELLKSGFIGDLRLATIVSFSGFNRDPQERRHNWLSQESMGGGVLGAMASHQIDALRVWCGEIKAINGFTSTFVKERYSGEEEAMLPVTSDDSYAFMIRFASGAMGSVAVTSSAGGPRPTEVSMVGSQGVLRIINDKQLILTRPDGSEEELPVPDKFHDLPAGITTDQLDPRYHLQGPFLRLLERFLQGIREKRDAHGPTFVDGLIVQQCLDAIRSAERDWQPIDSSGK